ncbi:IS1380-Spn1 transposase [Streptococcus pneumoniae]|uniref:hypothetical protein n=1 Tax=Streptococcus pneumoniae TaxID=1313 RepID=UPI00076936B5|nr:hypothetical protein [Streptococcus pneumoniae]VJA48047.1 IS1380-Spn1 transposase [Streptococcus pneumoniae]VKV51643.1 IS1380-Spn1 transposase [Streptococcus pneumoniae]
MKEKKKNPLFVGILSIILGLLFPIVGLILGIIGLVLAISYQKESQLDYKIEKILNPQLFTPNLKTIQNPCLSLDPG